LYGSSSEIISISDELPYKKKYERSDEQPKAWPVNRLRGDLRANSQFYSLSQFSVFRSIRQPPRLLTQPSYLQCSKNYFDNSWSMSSHRRIKNVIVLLEWCPDMTQVRVAVDATQRMLNAVQTDRLRKAFTMFDVDGKGSLTSAKVADLLKALDVSGSVEELAEAITDRGAGNRAGLPVGWEQFTTDDGKTYFYHEGSNTTQWTKPSGPPAVSSLTF